MTADCEAILIVGTPDDKFWFRTWAGNDERMICAVRDAPRVSHLIEVINQSLKLSPKKVTCEGIISSHAPVIQFVPERPQDTPVYWREYAFLQDGERRLFSRVLKAVDGFTGTERIEARATVESRSSREEKKLLLTIDVSA